MPLETLDRGRVERLEILSPEGLADPAFGTFLPTEKLLQIYRKMTEIRLFDERALKLQRQGRLGTYPQILGQEATQIVPALCLKPEDWLLPTYRGQGCYYARGMELRYSLLYWAGDDRGTRFPEGNNDVMFAIPVGTHLTWAAGLAWAAKLRGLDQVALAYLGDGTSSKGDFHEALTFAGQFKLPVIYLIENNHWAISVPREKQSASKTLAQKAWGYGARGLVVDGNDCLAVYKAVEDAVDAARRGLGPTVLECETYRMGHHTTADDAARYRSPAELEMWRKKDPLARLKRHLVHLGMWDEEREARLQEEAQAMIQREIEAYEATPAPNPLNMFSDNYARAPWALVEQREELAELLKLKKSHEPVFELPPVEGRFP